MGPLTLYGKRDGCQRCGVHSVVGSKKRDVERSIWGRKGDTTSGGEEIVSIMPGYILLLSPESVMGVKREATVNRRLDRGNWHGAFFVGHYWVEKKVPIRRLLPRDRGPCRNGH